MSVMSFRKIFHWGPLAALVFMKIVTLTTIHCIRQWWPPEDLLSYLNFYGFIYLSGSSLYYFITAIYEGPGFLPLKWHPKNKEDYQYLQFCKICEGYKAPRSHHCRKCNRCVLKMDHHCPWINNCVGHYNHGYFTAFLTCAVCGCCLASFNLIAWLLTLISFQRNFPLPSSYVLIIIIFAIGLAVGVVFAVGLLLYHQLAGILRNATGIEDWILEKANHRRYGTGDVFVNPYSLNKLFNIKQVLKWHCGADGDGITWPIIDGCHQYTLTIEQILQKEEKRRRSRKYTVIKNYAGSWLPVTHGWRILCHSPFTTEPRIKLNVDDLVIVTRWRRYWMFGEKQSINADPKVRIRGWFPTSCVIEVIENGMDSSDNSKDDNSFNN